MKQKLKEAEVNANKREHSCRVNVALLNEEDRKAREQGYVLVRKKAASKVLFTQVISENMRVLIKKKLLTSAEMVILWQLLPFCEMNTNAIIHPEQNRFMSISEIARLLDRDRANTSEVINSLLQKGVLYEFVNAYELRVYGRIVTERPLFFNPELVYAGDKNKVNAVLCRLCINSDLFEKSKIFLDWKLWISKNSEYGRLYKRKTYLSYKKKAI